MGFTDSHSPMTNTRAAIASAFQQHNDVLQNTEETNKQDVKQSISYTGKEKSNHITPIGPGKMATIQESPGMSAASSSKVSGFPVQ